MGIQWSTDYETGHAVVDQEHKDIFALVQKVFDVSSSSRSEKIDEAVNFLADYTVKHFKHEESLMSESTYPDTDKHKKQHQDFLQSFLALKERIQKEGSTMQVHVEVNQTVVDWLITHVLGSDKLLADHYKAWSKK